MSTTSRLSTLSTRLRRPLRHLHHLLPVLAAAVVLVGGAEVTSYAATGQPLMLGRVNTTSGPTVLSNTGSGVALKLLSPAGTAPLNVESSVLVKRLNADRVDGLDASRLQTTTFRYRLPQVTGATRVRVALPGLPQGIYLATYSVVAGTTSTKAMIGCGFNAGGPGEGVEYGVRRPSTGVVALSGSAVLGQRADHPVTLGCFDDSGTFAFDSSGTAVSSVTLTRVDHFTDASATTTQ